MSKNKSNQKKLKAHTPDKVEQVTNNLPEENQNQNHNVKKVAMGTNTRHL